LERSGGAGKILGYTKSMKTAVSIPDPIFRRIERLAKRLKKSRSEVYAIALLDLANRQDTDEVTESMNRALIDLGEDDDSFASFVGEARLAKVEW
jgi:metal-responsive CopG/Arc/MetJ family transcriptional regulator